MTVVITRETPDHVEVRTFLAAADELYVSLYPTESRKALSLAKLLSTNVRFFVARRDGRALGCGGYMLLDEKAAEMKRLFVDPAARGQGVGRLIVRAIEHAAVQEGVEMLFLETGVKSFEAIGLYKGQDFLECGPFAAYEPDPLSVFMSKRLGMG